MSAREDVLHGLRQLDESQPGDLTPEQLLDAYRAEVLREAADELWALANRTTERGSGVLWAADKLRRMADEAAVR